MQTCFILTAATGEYDDYQVKNIKVSLDKAKLEVLKAELIEKDNLVEEQQGLVRNFTDDWYENDRYPITPQLEYPEFMSFSCNSERARIEYTRYYEETMQKSVELQDKWQTRYEIAIGDWLKENNISEDIMGIDPNVTYSIEEIQLI